MQYFRLHELKLLSYRIFLVFFFYFVTRILFLFFNWEFLSLDEFSDCLPLFFYGLRFDASAIFYSNVLFILLSLIPLINGTNATYQKVLKYIYFITNFIVIALNFVDLIYYRFTYGRSGISILESIENENNKMILLGNFLVNYWYVFALYIGTILVWVFLYNLVKVKALNYRHSIPFYVISSVVMCFGLLVVFVGMRGDYRKNSRPINLIDANYNLKNVAHTDVVLNTPFVVFRTISKSSFKKVHFTDSITIKEMIKPYKQYQVNEKKKLNVVIIIIESFGREYLGAFNQNTNIKNYESYTPFIDSLAQHSLILDNAFSNGYKSIHGMSSVLAGIPSFKDAFTSSPYPNQKIESLVSILNDSGYDTSFFHGAYNGSMGFLGFASTLGFDHYYGLDEYNNMADFDGSWAIWDEPYLQYFKKELDKKSTPFMATLFTASSHEPYVIPKEYEGKFRNGYIQMHPCVQYTDYAFKRFFEEAKKSPWFENTLFVMVADHGNQTYHEEFLSQINRHAVPILFYHPNSDLKGLDHQLSQQIDIYPTILDYLGYNKPFRSWGRSVLNENKVAPFCIKYSGSVYHFMQGNYICVFDGDKAIGFYDKNDLDLKNNLIGQRNEKMDQIEIACKAFLQDYFDKIMDRNLN